MRPEKLLMQLKSKVKGLEQDLKLEKEKNAELEKENKELKKAKASTRIKSRKSSIKKSEE